MTTEAATIDVTHVIAMTDTHTYVSGEIHLEVKTASTINIRQNPTIVPQVLDVSAGSITFLAVPLVLGKNTVTMYESGSSDLDVNNTLTKISTRGYVRRVAIPATSITI